MARRQRPPTVSPEAQEANRRYIEERLAAGRRPVRFRYQAGDQPGTQSTATPLRFLSPDTVLTIDHATRTPRAFRLDQLETLSEDEPRPEPMRVGGPSEIEAGREYRRKRKALGASAPDPAMDAPIPDYFFTPDRRP